MYKKVTIHANLIYVCGLVIIFAGALWMRMKLPPVPFSDRDTWGYLQPVLSKLTTDSVDPTYRGFFYPAILWAILKIYPDFFAIIVVQHGAGLIAGIFLVVAWQRMRVFLPTAHWIQPCYYVAGWLMLSVYLFSYTSILYEHTIRPEAFFPLITILCILLATEVSRRILIQTSRTTGTAILACLLTTLAFANYYLKPAWGLAVLVAIAPIVVIPGQVSRRLLPIALGILIVFGLFTIPEHYFHRGVGGSFAFAAQTIICASGEIVYEVLKADATLPTSDPRKVMADRLLPQFEAAIQSSRRPIPFSYSRLNPDTLMYDGAMHTLSNIHHGNTEQIIATCLSYYLRAWAHDPIAMLRKIVLQIAYFYCPWKSVTYAQAQDFHVTSHLQESLQNLQQLLYRESSYSWYPYKEYKQQLRVWQDRAPTQRIPSFIVALSTILNPLYMPIVALATGLALWVLFSKNLYFKDLRPSALWCLYLLSYNFVMTFTIAVLHMVTVDRYHFCQAIFSILSQSFATIFLVCVAHRLYQKRLQKRHISLS